MDQDDLEDEVFTKTILAHVDLFSASSRQIFEWQRRYIQTEILYAVALVLSVFLCLVSRKRFSFTHNEDSCEQKSADAAVFAIKGKR